MLRDSAFNNYYIIVREGKFKEVSAILHSYAGNADVYVKF